MTVVPLLVVRLLFRSKAGFGSLPHVVNAVSVFLDTSVELPLERASKLGSLPLLNRIWDSLEMLPDHSSWSVRRLLLQEDSYTERQFRLSLTEACKKNDRSMVQWIFEHFPGRGVRMQVVEEAAAAGAMDILQYFADNERDSEVDTRLAKRDIFFGGKDTANAAAGGHSDIVRWLYQFETDYERDDAATMEAAVANGDEELVRWLHQVMEIQVCGVPRAAANGHLSMLQFLSAFDRIPAGVVVQAAKNGHLDVVRWAIDRDWDNEKDEEDSDEEDFYTSGFYSRQRKISRPPYLTSIGGEASLAVHTAAINGHLKVAKYLHARVDWPMDYEEQKVNSKRLRSTLAEIEKELGKDHQAAPISRKTMLEVVRKGLLEVVEWLCFEFSGNHTIDLFRPLNEEDTLVYAMDEAAAYGHLDIVKFLHEVAPSLEEEFSRKRKKNIAEKMNEAMFGKRSKRHGIQCTTEAMDGAAANNHLEVVMWLHDNRSEGCTNALDRAAGNGHIEMVQWLHAHRSEGCTTIAMNVAAGFGHLDVLKWLHEHTSAGCTTHAMDRAAASGHLNVVKWLQDNRHEGCTKGAMDGAAENGHLGVVKWLHENRSEGCTNAAMDFAAQSGKLDVVKFLHRYRTEGCTAKAMSGAAAGGHVRVMQWLHANRPEDCSGAAIDDAALHGAFEAALFLFLVRGEKMSQEVIRNDNVRGYPGFYDFIFEKMW